METADPIATFVKLENIMSELEKKLRAELRKFFKQCDATLSITATEKSLNSYGFCLDTPFGKFHMKVTNPANIAAITYPELELHGLLVAERMAQRRNVGHSPMTSYTITDNKDFWAIPDLPEGSVVCQISRYVEGRNYQKVIEARSKSKFCSRDEAELAKIADAICAIHHIIYNPTDTALAPVIEASFRTNPEVLEKNRSRYVRAHIERLKGLYNQYVSLVMQKREIQLFRSAHHPLIESGAELRMYASVLKLALRWQNSWQRLRALHGDFWESNLTLCDNGKFELIDDSKIPWGDPAHDIAWWIEEDRWRYHQTGNAYWRERADCFIRLYKERTGDTLLEEAMCLGISLKSLVKMNPRYIDKKNGYSERGAERYRENVELILEQGRHFWLDSVV